MLPSSSSSPSPARAGQGGSPRLQGACLEPAAARPRADEPGLGPPSLPLSLPSAPLQTPSQRLAELRAERKYVLAPGTMAGDGPMMAGPPEAPAGDPRELEPWSKEREGRGGGGQGGPGLGPGPGPGPGLGRVFAFLTKN